MVEHDIYRVAACFQIDDGSLEKEPRSFPVYGRQDDEAGMNLDLRDQFAEITCVLRDNDPILRDAACENCVIRLTAAANMKRMHRVIATG